MPPVFCVQKEVVLLRLICISIKLFSPQLFATKLRQLRDVTATSLCYSSFRISSIF